MAKKRTKKSSKAQVVTDTPIAAKVADGDVTGSSGEQILTHASNVLFIATGVAILLVLATLYLPDGKSAVMAISGLPSGIVIEKSARWVFALDTLYPAFYGGGLALFFAGLRSQGNRLLVRLVLIAILIVIGFDFFENGIAYSVMTGASDPSEILLSVSSVKYMVLAFAGIVGSTILPAATEWMGRLVGILLRYLFPLTAVMLLAGLVGDTARVVIGVGFAASLALIAIYAQNLAAGHSR